MWKYNHTDELMHYGILGMKWGVRRSDAQLARARKSKKTEEQRMSEKQKRADVKNRGTLTNEELRQKINRLQMEKQLRELTDDELNRGRREVTSLLKNIGTSTVSKVATTALSGAALYGLKAVTTKKFDAGEFGSAIFNGGSKKK